MNRPLADLVRRCLEPVPDSRMAAMAEELLGDIAPDFLRNHCYRSYSWAVALADIDDVSFDSEILYVSALLHDIALLPEFDAGGCFEADGAEAARKLAVEAGAARERADAVSYAIASHMNPDETVPTAPEAFLLWQSTGTDVSGYRLDAVPGDVIGKVLDARPRLDFKERFAALFAVEARRKPACRVAEMMRSGFAERIFAAPFDS